MGDKEFKCGDAVITRKRLIREVNCDKSTISTMSAACRETIDNYNANNR